ncbi:hypothetical protein [Pseudomonas phage U1B]|nr:hypothetical protein [Pseudomonas phage T2P]QYV99226.1 hypothetical protein [Pseudomonas phage U1B]QYV99682.1 hypothetical protein [Pseudomonas phage U5]
MTNHTEFNFDLDRMKKAINSGTITLPTAPSGLTREEKRAFIRKYIKDKLKEVTNDERE